MNEDMGKAGKERERKRKGEKERKKGRTVTIIITMTTSVIMMMTRGELTRFLCSVFVFVCFFFSVKDKKNTYRYSPWA